MNEMYKYLKEHSYISQNKKSNYQFELSEERAECIANKYENLINDLQQENKQLKEQLLITQTNEETFRLEMKDITQTLGLDEDTIFDDVKAYARSLKDNWNELKEYINEANKDLYWTNTYDDILDKMQELEQGSDSNE